MDEMTKTVGLMNKFVAVKEPENKNTNIAFKSLPADNGNEIRV
jgi:hypothetical protein